MAQEDKKKRIVMFKADLHVAKLVLQVFLLLSRFKYSTIWYEEDSNGTILKPFTSAESLCKNKRHMHKSRDIINKCRFPSTSQLEKKNLFSVLCSKNSVLFVKD